jgi:hypothetical protein
MDRRRAVLLGFGTPDKVKRLYLSPQRALKPVSIHHLSMPTWGLRHQRRRVPAHYHRDERRTSACKVTGFSSRHTTGSLESYGFSYVPGHLPSCGCTRHRVRPRTRFFPATASGRGREAESGRFPCRRVEPDAVLRLPQLPDVKSSSGRADQRGVRSAGPLRKL